MNDENAKFEEYWKSLDPENKQIDDYIQRRSEIEMYADVYKEDLKNAFIAGLRTGRTDNSLIIEAKYNKQKEINKELVDENEALKEKLNEQ